MDIALATKFTEYYKARALADTSAADDFGCAYDVQEISRGCYVIAVFDITEKLLGYL